MLTTTQEIVAITQQESIREGSKAGGDMQDGVVELELELKTRGIGIELLL